MKRAVYIIITIIITAALFAVGVNAEEYTYTIAEMQSIMNISNYYYFLKDENNISVDYDQGVYLEYLYQHTGTGAYEQVQYYGRRLTNRPASGITIRCRYPVSSTYNYTRIEYFIGYYENDNEVYNHTRIDSSILRVEGVAQDGTVFEIPWEYVSNPYAEGYFYSEFEKPILFFDLIINISSAMSSWHQDQLYIGISKITAENPVVEPDLPTLEENIYTITQLIQMNITPAIENINNYITLIQQQEQTSINNLNQSNYNYNSTLNDYSSGTINADQAFNEITTEFDNSIENAVENGSVEEAILANQMYQSKLKTLEKYFEKTVASKYENLVSNEEKNMVNQAVQLEESILEKFDIEEFRAQTRYDTYYQQISNQEMLNLKEIYEKILNDDIGNDFVIIPLTFSILAILLGATGALIAKGKKSND